MVGRKPPEDGGCGVNSNSIDREQSFQTTVNRDSDVVVNTSSSPIGIGGVSRSWTCVDDIVKSGLCVSAEPRHSASTGNRNPSSGSRWPAAPSIRKIGRKTAEEVGGGRAPARESPRGSSTLVRVADERMSRGTASVPIPSTGGDPSKFKHGGLP